MSVTAARTRCNKVQLEMPAETARLLFVFVGNLNLDNIKGTMPVHSTAIKAEAQAIRNMCSDLYDPLKDIVEGSE